MDDAQLQEILERIGALELVAQGDGAAVPSFYTINNEGEITNVESEVVNELVAEEGDLIIGGGGKKGVTLPKGKPGQVLTVGKKGQLEWATPEAGGGGAVKRIIAGLINGEAEESFGAGFSFTRLSLGHYRIEFDTPFETAPFFIVGASENGVDPSNATLVNGEANTEAAVIRVWLNGGTVEGSGVEKTQFADNPFYFIAVELA